MFERFLPWTGITKIDIGEINHSEIFLRRLVDPCYCELLKRLRNYLNQVLPCTGQPLPITILADKGTIKHDTLQLTLIQTLCLKKGVLFERFFIGNPEVVNHGGFNITEMLINTVCDTLDITL